MDQGVTHAEGDDPHAPAMTITDAGPQADLAETHRSHSDAKMRALPLRISMNRLAYSLTVNSILSIIAAAFSGILIGNQIAE
jgi:hypothetical protein